VEPAISTPPPSETKLGFNFVEVDVLYNEENSVAPWKWEQ